MSQHNIFKNIYLTGQYTSLVYPCNSQSYFTVHPMSIFLSFTVSMFISLYTLVPCFSIFQIAYPLFNYLLIFYSLMQCTFALVFVFIILFGLNCSLNAPLLHYAQSFEMAAKHFSAQLRM